MPEYNIYVRQDNTLRYSVFADTEEDALIKHSEGRSEYEEINEVHSEEPPEAEEAE